MAAERTAALTLPGIRLSEEDLNQWTHGFGCVLSLVGSVLLMRSVAGNPNALAVFGSAIYCLTMVMLYAASTLSHSFLDTQRRSFWRVSDQVCIFLFIAGGFTPFALVHLSTTSQLMLLLPMWILALTGSIFRIRDAGKIVSVKTIGCYAALGWIPILCLFRIWEVSGVPGTTLVLGGAVCYMVGTFFLINDHHHPCYHAIWHLLVILGSTSHFCFHLFFVAA